MVIRLYLAGTGGVNVMLICNLLVLCAAICLSSVFMWMWSPPMVQGQMDDDSDETQDTSTTMGYKEFFYNLSLFDPNREFEPIEFDQQIAGGFHINNCLKDLMNCWSILKAETLCHYQNLGYLLRWRNNTWWGSACDIMRDYCNNAVGDLYVPETKFWFKMTKKKLAGQDQDCPAAPEWT